MRYLIYSDVHWSTYSSIIRGRGLKYSTRLENLIKSVSWAEGLAEEEKCDRIICLGDFFDKPYLNAEELTALSCVEWANLPHIFLVGNHEVDERSLAYSSCSLFGREPGGCGKNILVSSIYHEKDVRFHNGRPEDIDMYFIPWSRDTESLGIEKGPGQTIIFSHNDIKGIKYGGILSPVGYDIEEIKNSCDLFINGHIHNGGVVSDGIINVGNLTGQNFGEDGFTYRHCVCILDTSDMSVRWVENPHAFNFYKIDFTSGEIEVPKDNAVISGVVKNTEQYNEVKKMLDGSIYRLVLQGEVKEDTKEEKPQIADIDYLGKFEAFMLDKIGDNDIVKEELKEVCL